MSLDMTWVDEHYDLGSELYPSYAVCKTCGQPSWHVTRHAAERHGSDVDVMPAKVPRPDWMTDEWI